MKKTLSPREEKRKGRGKGRKREREEKGRAFFSQGKEGGFT